MACTWPTVAFRYGAAVSPCLASEMFFTSNRHLKGMTPVDSFAVQDEVATIKLTSGYSLLTFVFYRYNIHKKRFIPSYAFDDIFPRN